MLGKLGTLQ